MPAPVTAFVPWVADQDDLVAILPWLSGPIVPRLRPRVGAAPRRSIDATDVYVDLTDESELDLRDRVIPVVAVDAGAPALERAARAPHVALRVAAAQFEDDDVLDARVEAALAVLTRVARIDLLVDIPDDRPPPLVETVAAGVARRIPHPSTWVSVVCCFETHVVRGRGLVRHDRPGRPQLGETATPIVWGESFALPRGALGYPFEDQWLVAHPYHGSGAALAGLIVDHVGFGGPACCAGDRWLVAAAHGQADAADADAWRQAAFVHWLTSAVH